MGRYTKQLLIILNEISFFALLQVTWVVVTLFKNQKNG